MKRAQQVIQAAWLVAAVPIALSAVVRGSVATGITWSAGWMLLAAATALIWRPVRAGFVLSGLISLALLGYVGAWGIRNLWAYLTHDELYLDSPATIYVVLLILLVTVLPSMAVLPLSVRNLRSAA